MQVMRRTIVALGAAATLLALVGCGGLGVNLGSGAKGSSNPTHVTIFVVGGSNQPIVLNGHTITLQSIAYDERNFITATQGAIWSTRFADSANEPAENGIFVFLDPSCTAPAPVTSVTDANGFTTITTTGSSQTICVLALFAGTQSLSATVAGATGTVNVTVTE